MPAVTTTHNKEATIFVGESRPVITGSTIVDLRWTGTAEAVDIYRDGQLVDTSDDNGRYRDRFTSMATTVSYKICVAGTDTCSADLDVSF